MNKLTSDFAKVIDLLTSPSWCDMDYKEIALKLAKSNPAVFLEFAGMEPEPVPVTDRQPEPVWETNLRYEAVVDALVADKFVEAVKLFRDATQTSLTTALDIVRTTLEEVRVWGVRAWGHNVCPSKQFTGPNTVLVNMRDHSFFEKHQPPLRALLLKHCEMVNQGWKKNLGRYPTGPVKEVMFRSGEGYEGSDYWDWSLQGRSSDVLWWR